MIAPYRPLLAFGCILALTCSPGASAQVLGPFNTGGYLAYTIPGLALQATVSGLAITNVYLLTQSTLDVDSQQPDDRFECVNVTNVSSKTIVHTQFLFLYTSMDGRVLHNDPLDIHNSIKPGDRVGRYPYPYTGACRDPEAYFASKSFFLYNGYAGYAKQNIYIVATVNEVDFANGTSWHAPSVPSRIQPLPSPLPITTAAPW